MPKQYGYTSIDRIFSKLDRDVSSDFNEDYVIEQAGEALELMETPNLLEDAVAFMEVKNFQCYKPKYCQSILQIARNNYWTPKTKTACTPKSIIDEIPNVAYQKCNDCGDEDMGYVVLDGKGTPVLEYDIAYYRPYFDLKAERLEFSNSNYYKENYSPVRLATGTFFSSINEDNGQAGCGNDAVGDKYQIINKEILRFSFQEGYVAVAFKRQQMDEETGYPMIPEEISHTTAIVWYITYKMATKRFLRKEQGMERIMAEAEKQWIWYCGQSKMVDMMPYTIDDYQNLGDSINKMIPLNEYDNFFGSLANPEYRKWNDSNNRNIRRR